jgi:quercetin dioxygenase-like cupin family protein
MSELNRREFGMAMAAFAALASVAEAQTSKAGGVLTTQKVYRYDDLPVRPSTSGESRAVLQGTLPTGEALEVHETMLMPGQMPHQAHRHMHSELLLIREGTLDYLNEGKPERAVPGDVIYTSSMKLHGLKNVGTVPAKYFVVAIGVQSVPKVEATPAT